MHAGKDTKKAQAALKAVKKGAMKKERKVRKSVIFHRPKTLKRDRDPMYSRKGYVLTVPAPGMATLCIRVRKPRCHL